MKLQSLREIAVLQIHAAFADGQMLEELAKLPVEEVRDIEDHIAALVLSQTSTDMEVEIDRRMARPRRVRVKRGQ